MKHKEILAPLILQQPTDTSLLKRESMKRSNLRGNILLNATVLGVLVIVCAATLANYFQATKNKFINTGGFDLDVTNLKEQAELVIVGRLIKKRQKVTQTTNVIGLESGVSYFEIAVEEVERGFYGQDRILVAVGWFSSSSPPSNYTPFVKKDYDRGDRLRIYVNYDPQKKEYYTPALWYTIEPIGGFL